MCYGYIYLHSLEMKASPFAIMKIVIFNAIEFQCRGTLRPYLLRLMFIAISSGSSGIMQLLLVRHFLSRRGYEDDEYLVFLFPFQFRFSLSSTWSTKEKERGRKKLCSYCTSKKLINRFRSTSIKDAPALNFSMKI